MFPILGEWIYQKYQNYIFTYLYSIIFIFGWAQHHWGGTLPTQNMLSSSSTSWSWVRLRFDWNSRLEFWIESFSNVFWIFAAISYRYNFLHQALNMGKKTCWNSLLKRFLESHAGIVSWRKLHSYKSKLLSFLKLFYKEINNNFYVIRIFAV